MNFNQVILNLIVNAAHAISSVTEHVFKGKGLITIRTTQDGDWVEIRITDTGSGIPKGIRGRIFDRSLRQKRLERAQDRGCQWLDP